jgi:hypothetical protein
MLSRGFVWLVCAVALAGARVEAASCPPSARLEGDPGLVSPLRALLLRRGIQPRAAPGCAALAVAVRPARRGIHLVVSDAEGRTASRQLGRAEAAAMFIESWARTDLDASLPARLAPPGPELPELANLWAARDTDGDNDGDGDGGATFAPAGPLPTLPASTIARRLQVTTAFESAVDGARSLWLGAAVGLCVRLGPICAGTSVGLGRSAGARREEAIATVELPLAFGRFAVSPGLGLGLGRVHRDAREEDDDRGGRNRDPDRGREKRSDDPDGELTSPQGGRWRAGALRAHAGIAFFYPVAPRTGLELAATYGATAITGRQAPSWTDRLTGGELGLRLGLRYGRP